MSIQDAYVASWRFARSVAERAALLQRLEDSDSRIVFHLRTLFAIHDVEDMVRLDLAWWTYAALREVDRFLLERDGRARVFEYGAGASTLWLGRRAREVHSVEHDPSFAAILAPLIADLGHVHLHLVPASRTSSPSVPSQRRGHAGMDFTRYVSAIDAVDGEFDLIVVDGRARVASTQKAIRRLAPGGVLLLDDANRREYATVLQDPRLGVQLLRSATPSLPYPTVTALITRPSHQNTPSTLR